MADWSYKTCKRMGRNRFLFDMFCVVVMIFLFWPINMAFEDLFIKIFMNCANTWFIFDTIRLALGHYNIWRRMSEEKFNEIDNIRKREWGED